MYNNKKLQKIWKEFERLLEQNIVTKRPKSWKICNKDKKKMEDFIFSLCYEVQKEERKETINLLKKFNFLIIDKIGLRPIEERILMLRFFECKNLEECGRELGVTRERIRQMEAKALDKLRCLGIYNFGFSEYRCLCGRYKLKKNIGIICDRCGIEVQKSKEIQRKLLEKENELRQ